MRLLEVILGFFFGDCSSSCFNCNNGITIDDSTTNRFLVNVKEIYAFSNFSKSYFNKMDRFLSILPFQPTDFDIFQQNANELCAFCLFTFQSFDFTVFNRLEIMVVDVGVPADWVKVNVQRMVRFSFLSLVCNHLYSCRSNLTSFTCFAERLLRSICISSWASAGGGK